MLRSILLFTLFALALNGFECETIFQFGQDVPYNSSMSIYISSSRSSDTGYILSNIEFNATYYVLAYEFYANSAGTVSLEVIFAMIQ